MYPEDVVSRQKKSGFYVKGRRTPKTERERSYCRVGSLEMRDHEKIVSEVAQPCAGARFPAGAGMDSSVYQGKGLRWEDL